MASEEEAVGDAGLDLDNEEAIDALAKKFKVSAWVETGPDDWDLTPERHPPALQAGALQLPPRAELIQKAPFVRAGASF